jgi:hypothetical protein
MNRPIQADGGLKDRLRGGDRRSIGQANEIAAEAAANPALVAALVAALANGDAVVRMRAADALEKASGVDPGLLSPYARSLLDVAESARQQELRWHLAQMLPRLPLDQSDRVRAVAIMRGYLDDRSAIVRTFSLQALADIAVAEPAFVPQVTELLQQHADSGSAAVRSRCRKLLAGFSPAQLDAHPPTRSGAAGRRDTTGSDFQKG